MRAVLGGSKGFRPTYRRLPAERRCKECLAPFDGAFSLPFRLVQIHPSRKNPNMCTMCYEFAPPGETQNISVLFVDVSRFTALSETLPPNELVIRLNRFYKLAAEAVFAVDGTLDKLVGDEVMAFFGAPSLAEDHPVRAVDTAIRIVRGVQALAEGGLEVGAGVGTGNCFVGNVGEGEVSDFTVMGDVVNTTARVQGAAGPGEILVTEETYRFVRDRFPDAPRRELDLKGKSQPVVAYALSAW